MTSHIIRHVSKLLLAGKVGSVVRGVGLAVIVFVVCGCTANNIPAQALQLSPESMHLRQLQTRRFETKDENALLIACVGLLQDLGFSLDESESKLGVVVASKDRSAVETGEVVAAVFLAALTGVYVPTNEKQRIRASLVTRPLGELGENIVVRVTFQRTIWNDANEVSRIEALTDEKMYQHFFAQLSKAVFLEAHSL